MVLRRSSRPLTVREIVDLAVADGLLSPTGRTPQATMSAQLYRSLQRDPNSPFARQAEPGPTRAVRGSVRWTYQR
jgi:hypothetical protein